MSDSTKRNQLIIKKSFLEKENDKCYLKAELVENGESRTMFFGVENQYASALTPELADCFLIAVFPHAITENLDIVCETPVSRHLLYSLKTRLIPELSGHVTRYHAIRITAKPSDMKFQNNTAVGMGWSGGVDCLYTLIEMRKAKEPRHQLTHFLNLNAGVFEGSEENMQKEFHLNSEEAKRAAAEFGLNTIDVDTNIHLLFHEIYLFSGPFRLCACMLALQKLFSVYYVSSACEVTKLSFEENNAFYCEYAICSCCGTQNITFYDIGSEITRIEKLNRIADDPVAQKYLHVCVKSSKGNCLRCGKCVRTIAALYALGKLDRFYKVFDRKKLEKEIDYILGDALFHQYRLFYKEIFDLLDAKGIKLNLRARQYAASLAQSRKEKLAKICRQRIQSGQAGYEEDQNA